MRDAIEALSMEEHSKLRNSARFHAASCSVAPEDLLQEAVTKALDGKRRCPADTNIAVFLSNVMRSLASNWRRGRQSHPTTQMSEEAHSARIESPEEGWIRREELERALALFEDDPVALRVATLLPDYRGAELCVAAGISTGELATVLRRIRRRVKRAQKEGTL